MTTTAEHHESPTTETAHPTAQVAVRMKRSPWFKVVLWLGILVVIWIIISMIPRNKAKKSEEGGTVGTTEVKESSLPAQFDTTITLRKGQKNPPIKVPVWYNYEISDPGKRFAHRVENQEKVDTMGGGYPYIRPSEHVRFFELSALDEEVSVTIYFSKK